MSDLNSIRQRAFEIWEAAGRPEGRDQDHWLQAEAELAAAVPPLPPATALVRAKKSPAKPKVAKSGNGADAIVAPAKPARKSPASAKPAKSVKARV